MGGPYPDRPKTQSPFVCGGCGPTIGIESTLACNCFTDGKLGCYLFQPQHRNLVRADGTSWTGDIPYKSLAELRVQMEVYGWSFAIASQYLCRRRGRGDAGIPNGFPVRVGRRFMACHANTASRTARPARQRL
jgi:hypothetical protein